MLTARYHPGRRSHARHQQHDGSSHAGGPHLAPSRRGTDQHDAHRAQLAPRRPSLRRQRPVRYAFAHDRGARSRRMHACAIA